MGKVRIIRSKIGTLGTIADIYAGQKFLFSKIIKSQEHEQQIKEEVNQIIVSKLNKRGSK